MGGAAALLHFGQGPIPADFVRSRLVPHLSAALGQNVRIDVASAAIARDESRTHLVLTGFAAHDNSGRQVFLAPQAVVTFNPVAAIFGSFSPSRIDLVGLDLTVNLAGSTGVDINVAPAGMEPQPPPADAATPGAAQLHWDASAALRAAVGRLGAIIDEVASNDGRLAALEQFGLRRGRIRVIDSRDGHPIVFSNVSASIGKTAEGNRSVRLEGSSASGPWTLQAEFALMPDGKRRMTLAGGGLPLTEIAAASQLAVPVAAATRLGGALAIDVDPSGALSGFSGRLDIDGLAIALPFAGQQGLVVGRVSTRVALTPADELRFDEAIVESGGTRLSLGGRLRFRDDGSIAFVVDQGSGVLDAASSRHAPVTVAAIKAAGDLGGGDRTAGSGVTLQKLEISGPEFAAAATGRLTQAGERPGLALSLSGSAKSVSAALRLWPPFVAPELREYLLIRVDAGAVEKLDLKVALPWQTLQSPPREWRLGADAVAARFDLREATLRPIDGLPVVEVPEIKGEATGTSAKLTFAAAAARFHSGKHLALRDGHLTFTDGMPGKPVDVDGVFRVSGSAEALTDLLAEPLVGSIIGRDLPASPSRGRVDLRVSFAMPIRPRIDPREIAFDVAGSLQDATLDKAFGGEALQAANLTVRLDKAQLAIKGDATLQGIPATIDLKSALRGGGEIALALKIDDAVRARRGFGANSGITGLALATIRAPLGKRDAKPRVDVDLTKVVIAETSPGTGKPAGTVAKASFLLNTRAGGYELTDFAYDAGNLQLRGSVTVDGNLALRSAKFDKARLSPGDVARLTLERAGAGWKATIRANTIDARPFLAGFFSGQGGGTSGGSTLIDVDVKTEILTGHDAEALSNVSLRFVKEGAELKQFELAGRFGGAAVSGQIARRGEGASELVVQSANAGAALRFANLYRRMQGGTLLLQSAPRGARRAGILTIRNFALRDEPALKRVLADPAMARTATNSDRSDAQPAAVAYPNDGTVRFSRLRVEFVQGQGRLDLRDAVMWGALIGANIEGHVDFARDAVDLTGTFVPAYGLNNAFSKVPVLGFFLSGGEHGGLFAVNFKINGSLARPRLTVNPLSAIAPGIFRKFFEFSRVTDRDQPLPPRVESGGAR
jgi:hypothetical protein